MSPLRRKQELSVTLADIVILAAGESSRMGEPKMFLPFGAMSIINYSILHALEANLNVIVICHPDYLEKYDTGRFENVHYVVNMWPQRGMRSSAVLGMSHVTAQCFFLQPADMPVIQPKTYQVLLKALNANPDRPVVPTWQGQRGHPLLLPASFIEPMRNLSEDTPFRDYINAANPFRVEVEDEGVSLDIDTPEDYAALLEREDLRHFMHTEEKKLKR